MQFRALVYAILRASTLLFALFLAGCAHTLRPIDSQVSNDEVPFKSGFDSVEVLPTVSGSSPGPVAINWQKYLNRKKYVGNGHCVILVLDAVPSLGNTVHWVRGDHVYGNASLEPGTPIATFNDVGVYGNRRGGRSHAALYLDQDESGIYVIDQWRPTRKSRGQRPKQRFIPWTGGADTRPANLGLAYYVINRLDPIELGNAEDQSQ